MCGLQMKVQPLKNTLWQEEEKKRKFYNELNIMLMLYILVFAAWTAWIFLFDLLYQDRNINHPVTE